MSCATFKCKQIRLSIPSLLYKIEINIRMRWNLRCGRQDPYVCLSVTFSLDTSEGNNSRGHLPSSKRPSLRNESKWYLPVVQHFFIYTWGWGPPTARTLSRGNKRKTNSKSVTKRETKGCRHTCLDSACERQWAFLFPLFLLLTSSLLILVLTTLSRPANVQGSLRHRHTLVSCTWIGTMVGKISKLRCTKRMALSNSSLARYRQYWKKGH